ncbi:MAG: Lrp/AsnC family transcriptional regulator [Ilumatobacteraceae bacterium]|jgi:Lrp/AsnC family transcriptional regulator for asnA, asnC and gidA|nr:Lrp/AsnC family transcriptional regulator [Acidimicrobiaceae bacterium]MBP6487417.1 Lrp/AsnC family transcriptional regulator [Ilumatobacteraceae bacterium]MBK9970572.1 Lrp/AsnC family transcriptional regulator [Acidimicrobiaceae bacterium]MBP7888178.1 Lrp/AsnC family transcriptional regulator [Ilumatobacteraceae bacterium]MBP8210123.1 Lrp/AsnC family transcriptional regulator [Ilumatobacteraceae bacterium]
MSATTGPAALDDKDRTIIELLQADGRMPFTKVAAEVGLTEGAIRQRVQRLTDTGVMQIVAVTDPLSLGMRRVAMIGARVGGDAEATAASLSKMEEVEYLVATAGRYDLMFEVVADDDTHLMSLLSALRGRDDILEAEAFVCLKLFKQTFSWGAR